MPTYLIVGAGPVGRATAELLAAAGHDVTLASRSGTSAGSGARAVAVDATDGAALAKVAHGADAILMCAMAPYDRWPSEFPPIMAGTVAAAREVNARLVIAGNMYVYGQDAPAILSPSMPLQPTTRKARVRQAMWEQALAAGVPALEVRSSDYLGPGAGSLFTLMTLPALLAGQPAPVVGNLDVLHPWTYTQDVARTLVAVLGYQGAWGRAFHVPSVHLPVRSLAHLFARAAGLAEAQLQTLSDADLRTLAETDTIMREVLEMQYLYTTASVVDASDTECLLGVSASPLEAMVRSTLDAIRR